MSQISQKVIERDAADIKMSQISQKVIERDAAGKDQDESDKSESY